MKKILSKCDMIIVSAHHLCTLHKKYDNSRFRNCWKCIDTQIMISIYSNELLQFFLFQGKK